jgi:hypothetical protein
MFPDNLSTITDEELLALQKRHLFSGEKSTLTGRESERVWEEIVRRRKLKNEPSFGEQGSSSTQSRAQETDRTFDPKADISADARYLWKRIFIWFWLVPFVIGLLYWLAVGVVRR